MAHPLISIIVPIYNVEKYLEDCLESIAQQSSTNFITLLIDDGSKDNSGTIAKQYVKKFPQLFALHEKKNGGLSDARNYGIAEAKTDYVMFVDSDDIVAVDTVEKASNILNSLSCDVLCFGMTEINERGEYLRNIAPTIGSLALTSLNQSPALIIETLPNACNKVINTALFKENNIEFPKGLWYEDLATIPKLFDKANKIAFLSDNLYHYRTREGSITQTISPKILDMILVLKSLDKYFGNIKNNDISNTLLSLKLNMIMKTLVRISASNSKEEQLTMLKQVKHYLNHNMPNSLGILSLNGKLIYKFILILASLNMNKLLLAILKICLTKGLVRA